MKRIRLILSLFLLSVNFTAFDSFAQVTLAGGEFHSLYLCPDGKANSWGINLFGMLGDGTTTSRRTPVPVNSLTGVTAISAGEFHTLFLKGDGTAWATGYNSNGQLGDGTVTQRTTPVQVSGLSGIIAVAAGENFSLFLKSDGTVWGCGYNADGQLGDSTQIDRHTVVQAHGLTGVVAIAGGTHHSLFLRGNGTVWACGQNYRGQLGTGNNMEHLTPVQMVSLSNVVAIAAGWEHSLFLKNDSTVWGCGYNVNGQLGDGTGMNRILAVQVNSLTRVVSMDGGGDHSVFCKADGTAWACGYNPSGELGNGTTGDTNKLVTQVIGLTGITKVAGGTHHSLFCKNDGSVWACGANSAGQLGDSTMTQRLAPVNVLYLCANPVGIAENTAPLEWKFILRNQPTREQFEATLFSPENSQLIFDIYNYNGELIKSELVSVSPGANDIELKLNDIAGGIYFARIHNNERSIQQKFVKL
jgi:alpha-tubulin suppressor-like RCC1 family protein